MTSSRARALASIRVPRGTHRAPCGDDRVQAPHGRRPEADIRVLTRSPTLPRVVAKRGAVGDARGCVTCGGVPRGTRWCVNRSEVPVTGVDPGLVHACSCSTWNSEEASRDTCRGLAEKWRVSAPRSPHLTPCMRWRRRESCSTWNAKAVSASGRIWADSMPCSTWNGVVRERVRKSRGGGVLHARVFHVERGSSSGGAVMHGPAVHQRGGGPWLVGLEDAASCDGHARG